MYPIEVDECASFPCLNNCTCMDQINEYRCKCGEGFTGVICATGRQIAGTSHFGSKGIPP